MREGKQMADRGGFGNMVKGWLKGRNGADELATFAIVIALLVVIVNYFVRSIFLSGVALALMVFAWWRMSSRHVKARVRENRAFAELLGPARPWLRDPGAAFTELRSFKHLRCPNCSQRMRVPRGKGNLRVRCPKCHEKFEART